MKKIISLLIVLCMLCAGALYGCSDKAVIGTFDDENYLPTYFTRLYSEKESDERYAALLRPYDGISTKIAVCDTVTGDFNVLYTLPEGTVSYELYAAEGIIAFYQLTAYTDSSVNYSLKVIDTANEQTMIESPYSKTVGAEGDTQTRFICVYDRCVYYLTASPLLNSCRVMKYDIDAKTLEAFCEYEMTENTLTGGHSCTFININNGYLICGCVEKYLYTLKIYNLRTGNLVKEKALPANVGVVYNADYDAATGIYAVYYCETNAAHEFLNEKIAYTTEGSETLVDIFTAAENVYVNRETVKIYNNVIYYNVQNGNSEIPYNAFSGAMYNIMDGTTTLFSGSLETWIFRSSLYNLSFDKKAGFEKMKLTKTEIK